MGEYTYLAAIIGLISSEYALSWIIYASLKMRGILPEDFFGKTISQAGSSWIRLDDSSHGIMNIVLLVYRIVAFGWLGVFATIVGLSMFFPTSWHYYTIWNLILISLYFLLAIISSICHLLKSDQTLPDGWSRSFVLNLGKVVGVSFGFVASSALMVTTLNFMLLNPKPTFWNVTEHLTQLIAILIEFSLNAVPVNPQEVMLAISWPMLYLVFIWPIVGTNIRGWPYYFLEVSSASAFVWYQILFAVCVVFFFVFYGLDVLKWRLISGRGREAPTTIKPLDPTIRNFDPSAINEDNNHPL